MQANKYRGTVISYRLPPLSTLLLFEAAGRRGSFKAAARALGVTPSAVTHGIQSLEDWLGSPLFARRSGQLALTPSGRDYLEAVSSALRLLTAADAALLSRKTAETIRLTVVPTFASQLLLPSLPSFQQLYPSLSLSIDTNHDVVDLEKSGFHLGIRLGGGVWEGLIAEKLLTEQLIPIRSPDTIVQPEASFTGDTLIHTTAVKDDWAVWAQAAGLPPPKIDRGFRVDTSQMALAAAAEGVGIAMGRLPGVAREFDRRLVPCSAIVADCQHAYWLVATEQSLQRPEVKAFTAWLRGELQRVQSNAAAILRDTLQSGFASRVLGNGR